MGALWGDGGRLAGGRGCVGQNSGVRGMVGRSGYAGAGRRVKGGGGCSVELRQGVQQLVQGSRVDRIIPKLIRRLDQLTEEIGSIGYDPDCSRNF